MERENEVIWNPDRTMNFLASMYLASYIYNYKYISEGKRLTEYRIRVQLKGVTLNTPSKWPGLWYANYNSEEEAKKGLAQLTEELVRAGVIKEPKNTSSNRFDCVDLQNGKE